MERNAAFQAETVRGARMKLTWAQAEVMTSIAGEIRLVIAGDDESVAELRAEQVGEDIVVSQPQLGFAKEILPRRRWLEICLCVPAQWVGDLDIDNASGMVSVRKIKGNDVSLTTVSGRLQASEIQSAGLSLHTVSGAIVGESLRARRLQIRSVSGRINLTDISFDTAKLFTVSGDAALSLRPGAKALDMQSVSGVMAVEVEGPVKAALHSISGQFLLSETAQPEAGCLEITASSVSGSLTVTGRSKPKQTEESARI